jgi:thiamine-monophosphate kinase
MSLNEFDLINTYLKRPVQHESIIKSIGDDCAILSVPDGYQLVISMDTLVSGRHFPVDMEPEHIATRAFCTCLSDLAAMGAEPRWFTLGLTLPKADANWLNAFSQSLLSIAQEYRCELVGGDTTQGPLTITLQVHGVVENNAALRRDHAQVGDTIFVTGCLGDGAAGLKLLLDDLSGIGSDDKQYLLERFYKPQPQIIAAQIIKPYANAAIDISDGLLADCQHIASASQVDFELEINAVPISHACQSSFPDEAINFALTGGDDYQIVFTVPSDHYQSVQTLIDDKQLRAIEIGKVVPIAFSKAAVRCFDNGQLYVVNNQQGYQHFAS